MEKDKLKKDKLVYRDGELVKVLRGKLKDEDGFFLNFECDASIYRINKKDVISLRKDKVGVENGTNNNI